MLISEPMTMATDYVLAVVSLIFGIRLFALSREGRQISVWLWATGFMVAGLSAVVGGSFHGFANYLSEGMHKTLWNTTMLSIGAASGFMLSGTYVASFLRWSSTARWLYLGLIVSIIGLAIQQSNLQLHSSINHNDIYHVIQLGALYLFYRAAMRMRD